MKQTKKAIRQLLQDAFDQVAATLNVSDLSKKTRKAFQQASKDLSTQLRDDLKKVHKKEAKRAPLSKKELRKTP